MPSTDDQWIYLADKVFTLAASLFTDPTAGYFLLAVLALLVAYVSARRR